MSNNEEINIFNAPLMLFNSLNQTFMKSFINIPRVNMEQPFSVGKAMHEPAPELQEDYVASNTLNPIPQRKTRSWAVANDVVVSSKDNFEEVFETSKNERKYVDIARKDDNLFGYGFNERKYGVK